MLQNERKMAQVSGHLPARRTRKLLRDALIALIEERGFDALTVGEISERAMVSRATFYRNYQDKYALVEQIFAEAMQALFAAVAETGPEHPPQMLTCFFEHIAKDARLYSALLGREGSPWFVQRMREALVDLMQAPERFAHWQILPGRPIFPPADKLVPDLVATMVVEAITWWLEQGMPYPPVEMARRCTLLVTAIFRETSTWE